MRAAAPHDYRWSSLILAIAMTEEFQSPPTITPPTAAGSDFSGDWMTPSGQMLTIRQTASAIEYLRGARIWTYHLNRWGNRFELPNGGKLVQARFDGKKLIVVAAPGLRVGSFVEVWSLVPDGNALAIELLNMTEVPSFFDFKESSISSAYLRTRTVLTRRQR